MKVTINIEFDEEKLYALELELKKERTTAAQFLGKTLDELYENKVPQPVRAFIDSKAAREKRPPRPSRKPVPGGGMNRQEAEHEQ